MESREKSIVVFGSPLCPDCVKLKEKLEDANIRFLYADITANLGFMKKFLMYRDTLEVFKEVREKGKIGIPFIVINKGEKVIFTEDDLDLNELR